MTSMPRLSRVSDPLEKRDVSRGRLARVGERTSIALSELPVEGNASGRLHSAGGSASRRADSLHELGLMLDDNLVDDLLLAEGPDISLPMEMAFRASGNARGSNRLAGVARAETANMEDTLAIPGSHGQNAWAAALAAAPLSSSGRQEARPDRARIAHEVQPPAFLLEPPLTIRSSQHAERFIDAGGSWTREAHFTAAPEAACEKEPRAMGSPERGIYAHLGPASIPVADGRFGFAIGEGGSGLGSGDSGSDDEPFMQRVVERLRINESIDRVRDWLWEIQPYLRGLASLVLPGWGQSLNEQPVKSRFFRMASFITLAAADLLLFRARVAMLISLVIEVDASFIARCLAPVALAGLFLWLTAIYDAMIVARTRRECQSTRI